ncbi:hypothetical protein EJV44_16815 [Ancylobacter aquaticus]|nr:hypothetical protein EJV44_16815 [Ancylobacter aquaticus]
MIIAFLRPSKHSKALVDDFNAPLGTLSARISASYALGLLTDSQFKDLGILRKIRNEFSHTWKPISFKDKKISSLIDQLSYSNLINKFPETNSEKMKSSLSCLLLEIVCTKNQIINNENNIKLIASRIIPGLPHNTVDPVGTITDSVDQLIVDLDNNGGRKKDFTLHMLDNWIARIDIVRRSLNPSDSKKLRDLIIKIDDKIVSMKK